MRALIVGAGAVGGTFGARLARAGHDVTFQARNLRARCRTLDALAGLISRPHG